MTPDDKRALQLIQSTVEKTDGRYVVGLPWIHDAPTLPNNRDSGMKCFFGLENQFKKKPDYAVRYAKAINQYIALGHARHLEWKELPGQEGKTWYLPHRTKR